MLTLDKTAKEKVFTAFADFGWRVSCVYDIGLLNKSGLLNSPIQKLVVEHDGTETPVVVKTLGPEPRLLFRELYEVFGHATDLQLDEFDRCCYFLSMMNMPERERVFYENHNKQLSKYIPIFFGSIRDDSGRWYLLMEDLSDYYCIDKAEAPESWGDGEIKLVLETLTYFHTAGLYSGQAAPQISAGRNLNEISAFLESLNAAMRTYSGIISDRGVDNAADKYISRIEYCEKILFEYGTMQIHHDFNIRNMCIDKRTWTLKVYDWEFIDNESPLMDLADFLISLSPEALGQECLDKWINIYCKTLNSLGKQTNYNDIKLLLYINILKFSATRMNMYLLFYCKKRRPYIERMYSNIGLILSSLGQQIDI